MPLTGKGESILNQMRETYGSEKKAESVLYASKNAGTITGIDAKIIDHRDSLSERLPAAISAGEVKTQSKNLWAQDPTKPMNNAAVDGPSSVPFPHHPSAPKKP